jgi:hypothetical protein
VLCPARCGDSVFCPVSLLLSFESITITVKCYYFFSCTLLGGQEDLPHCLSVSCSFFFFFAFKKFIEDSIVVESI